MYVLKGKVLKPGTPFTHEGLQYPGDWLAASTPAQRQALGIVLRDEPKVHYPFDSKYYFAHQSPRPLEEVQERLVSDVKRNAGAELSRSDWYLVRQLDIGTPVPQEILDQRAAFRKYADDCERIILSAETVEELEALVKGEDYPKHPYA